MASQFEKELRKLNQELSAKQKAGNVTVSKIEDWDAISALLILNALDYNSRETLLLGFAALNLVNAFANQCKKENQEHPKLNHHFRIHIRRLMRAYFRLNGNDYTMKFKNDKKYAIVSIYGFQFSFASERESYLYRTIQTENLVFDGIKKQNDAKYILDTISNLCGDLAVTQVGESLSGFLNYEKLEMDKYRFINGNCYKKGGLHYGDASKIQYKNKTRPELKDFDGKTSIYQATYLMPTDNGESLTFLGVYPLSVGSKNNIPVCDHVNLLKKDVDKYYGTANLRKGKKYCIIAKAEKYPKDERWGLNIGNLDSIIKEPIFPADELGRMNALYPDVFDLLERKPADLYRSERQKKVRIS